VIDMVLKTRSAAHEHKHLSKHEEEFKILARRNRLIGLWVAEKLGLTGDAATAYARDVVVSDLDEPGEDDVIRKIAGDLAAKGIAVADGEIADKMRSFLVKARAEVAPDTD